MSHRCEACGAAEAKLRCGQCQSVYYCTKKCQKRDWRGLHKFVCTEDPNLKRYVPIEAAVERALKKQPECEVTREATCYICLEGDNLLRGCACRGDSAGFVHVGCLVKYASSAKDQIAAWTQCMNCKEFFQDRLRLEMNRAWWQRDRNDDANGTLTASFASLATALDINDESTAANVLFNAAAKAMPADDGLLPLIVKLRRADALASAGNFNQALHLLDAMLPDAELYDSLANNQVALEVKKQLLKLLLRLERFQECLDRASQYLDAALVDNGPEHHHTLAVMMAKAAALRELHRYDASIALFEDVIKIESRIYGPNHPLSREARRELAVIHQSGDK